MEMVEASVLLTPGSYYHPWQGEEKVSTKARGAEAGVATFRFSFATPTVSLMDGQALEASMGIRANFDCRRARYMKG